jgi:membrane protein required for colicin V production
MIGPLSYVDVVLIALALISGLLAMYRGLSREILSIVSWIAAVAAALYFVFGHEALAQQISQQSGINQPKIVQVGIAGLIFLLVLIIVHFITGRISDLILDSQVGVIDRTLGFVFGALRAYMIVLLVYIGYTYFYNDPKAQHAFVTQSISRPLLDGGRQALLPSFLWLAEKLQSMMAKDRQT